MSEQDSKKIKEIEERIQQLEALSMSQTFLNATFLKFNAWMQQRRLVELDKSCGPIRLYTLPLPSEMDFLTLDGVRSITEITVIAVEPPKENKEKK